MANTKSSVGGAETILSLLGTAADMFGKVLLGPQAGNIDLGAPFKMGAMLSKEKRDQQSLFDVLAGNPATAPILDAGHQLHQSGGLINALGGGHARSMDASTIAAPAIPMPSVGGAPNGALGNESMGMPVGTPFNIHAPDAALRMAQGGRPDIAEKILLDQAQQKPGNPLDDVLKAFNIQKIQKDLNAPDAITMEGIKQDNALARIKAAADAQAELNKTKIDDRPVPASILKITNNLHNTVVDWGNLKNQVTSPEYINGMFSKSLTGQRILQTTSPQFILLKQQLESVQNKIIHEFGGSALTPTELKRILPTMPQITDDPEFFRQELARQFAKVREFELLEGLNYTKAGYGAEKLGYDPAELDIYARIKAAIKADPKKASSDERVISAIQGLDLDPSLMLPNYNPENKIKGFGNIDMNAPIPIPRISN